MRTDNYIIRIPYIDGRKVNHRLFVHDSFIIIYCTDLFVLIVYFVCCILFEYAVEVKILSSSTAKRQFSKLSSGHLEMNETEDQKFYCSKSNK